MKISYVRYPAMTLGFM